ncbi:MAG: phospho-N-acetylmuramoyl-pentapeptide-transferase [Candidatus Doudnabacteria bacterium RIFCSPLOWO2_02_FULL_49_13]|uniref:Phospho-N-acetylmuramoyl-pentapeptide-transferase n=1 Tax=Candidatus Doudnabacteria bacterium RIFCSPHIGHO2_12_FULL_48_16 TaxID=1817838 RepID=A0A1F5PME9_9BACT|nr:MAG: phospho-N-acetylmuramoyl-pentapeptide-transferase [Candidatus Doudnabacteria bacterium RIFCSPHIGHO2_02_FULL_49_24]OGE89447.1 MAG: phospho-N-acetylmuramoyl-pentapeptide-transferase [Candidatus Doudnabacteria bacterium RIFCSPHIGHO2_01_FULL_50_67]OGE90842.1 MAG: phospho-N-acetylmuramoyl-pentapeptide-transferase [Candidatus Doudnabacteria bacterium RIFCSPHIGHO2_12_FULL_48_16]OGE97553.1 MAG: phospho-N-acetylmuramoyl-pentapeptide-transferase [Candidatus Doudnabacteria bacterium RIFCSPLOWO2_01_
MSTTQALIKIASLASISFVLAMALTPLFTDFVFRNKFGKKIRADGTTPTFTKLHSKKEGTPTMGGILIWGTTIILAAVFWFLDRQLHWEFFHQLNFLTRQQTLLPLGALFATALLGLLDDYLGVKGVGGGKGGGLRMRYRVLFYLLVAVVGAYWFYAKLQFDILHIPGLGDFTIGWWYVPLFIFVVFATSFSVNQTDGLDGLAGGVLAVAFLSYGLIAFLQGRFELASLSAVLAGALLAFLWFNIYPARFFMGDTGSMSLGTVLAVMAFLTNSVAVLPLIGLILVVESGSSIIQLTSRKLLGRKVFLSSPIHHHFEAKGWPETKVTMRFWLIALIGAIIGVAINLIGR